jgi:hypothetical protein
VEAIAKETAFTNRVRAVTLVAPKNQSTVTNQLIAPKNQSTTQTFTTQVKAQEGEAVKRNSLIAETKEEEIKRSSLIANPQAFPTKAANQLKFADSHHPAPVHSLRAIYVGKLGQNTATQGSNQLAAAEPLLLPTLQGTTVTGPTLAMETDSATKVKPTGTNVLPVKAGTAATIVKGHPSDSATHGHYGPTTATLSIIPARENNSNNNSNPSVVAKLKTNGAVVQHRNRVLKVSPSILDDVVQHSHMNQGQTLQGTIVPETVRPPSAQANFKFSHDSSPLVTKRGEDGHHAAKLGEDGHPTPILPLLANTSGISTSTNQRSSPSTPSATLCASLSDTYTLLEK